MAKKPRWHEKNPEFDDYDLTLSKTEKKKALLRLQQIGAKLAKLSAKRIKELPTEKFVIEELLEFARIPSKVAQNRQIGRIGKVLSELSDAEVTTLTRALFELKYSPEQAAMILAWRERLITSDDNMKLYVKQYPAAEVNSINQQLIWFEHGKQTSDEGLMQAALDSLECYIMQTALVS